MLREVSLVALGGALGAVGRYGLSQGFLIYGIQWPWGTLGVNLVGSFLAGGLLALSVARMPMSPELQLFVMTGFLGGFTTYSAFSAELLEYFVSSQYGAFGLHFFSNTLGALVSVLLGYTLGLRFFV